jgi:ribosomal protein S18 acetylase RimI-like enzyme
MARVMHRFDCAELLLSGGVPVGLFKVARDGSNWRLIQIQLVPSLQGRGLGTQLLAELVAQASSAGASLTLNVLKANPAKALYERYGLL